MANYTGSIISALAVVVGLTSLFVYLHQRAKIPKLSFDGYFKREQPILTGHEPSKITTYYVRIEDINLESEGEIEKCAGSLIVNDSTYRTVWMSDKRHHNFVNEAWLKLFDIDSKDNTIGFFDTGGETKAKRSPASYGRRVGDRIMIELHSARGHCRSTNIESIEYIIKNAQYF